MVFTHMSGRRQTGEEYFADIADGHLDYDTIGIEKTVIEIGGDQAMLIKGTEDLRIRKTMTAIKESFEALICEKDYNDIKVTELCARAKINKKTFYHYYPTLDDLPIEMHMELSAAYIEPVKDYKLTEDTEEVTWIFFEYSAAQGLAYEKITCSSGSYSATQQIIYRVCRLQTVFL